MRLTLFLLCISLFSCKKDPPTLSGTKTICGTPGWPQGNWKVKCIVTSNTPDSVSFDINGGQTQSGTYYYKHFPNPICPLSDSTNFCGDLNSDINVKIYSTDTTKLFICSIYTNNNLIVQKTIHTLPNSTHMVLISGQCK